MAIDFDITPAGSNQRSFRISLDMDKILIGRGGSCDIRLPSPTVSFHHATIELMGAHYTLTDAESKNGTILNDKRLIEGKRYHLASNDVVTICGYRIVVNLSVPLRDPYSAEKTDVLEREMYLSSRAQGEANACLEIVEGPGAGKTLDLPTTSPEATMGTDEDCDLRVEDKKAGALSLLIVLTPTGWKIDEASLERAGRMVTCPARGRLHDGDDIIIGKTRIRFRDPVDRALGDLKTKRELETLPCREAAEPLPAERVREPDGPARRTPERKAGESEEKAPPVQKASRSPGRGKDSSPYGTEYRVAAMALGIIAFLVSLLILILIFF